MYSFFYLVFLLFLFSLHPALYPHSFIFFAFLSPVSSTQTFWPPFAFLSPVSSTQTFWPPFAFLSPVSSTQTFWPPFAFLSPVSSAQTFWPPFPFLASAFLLTFLSSRNLLFPYSSFLFCLIHYYNIIDFSFLTFPTFPCFCFLQNLYFSAFIPSFCNIPTFLAAVVFLYFLFLLNSLLN